MTLGTQENSAVAVYSSHTGAEAAVRALQRAGVDMKQLSIVGKDFHTEEHALGFYTAGDRMKFWGTRGAFWGFLWGMFFGSAFFFIPLLGPLVVMDRSSVGSSGRSKVRRWEARVGSLPRRLRASVFQRRASSSTSSR